MFKMSCAKFRNPEESLVMGDGITNQTHMEQMMARFPSSTNGPSEGRFAQGQIKETPKNGRKAEKGKYFERAVPASGSESKETTKPSIEIPCGWNRIVEKGEIVYISPNKSRLRSISDVISYLLTPATCKCGLVCPFRLEGTFNFNPNVTGISMLQKHKTDIKPCDSCAVNGGFEAVLTQFSPEKLVKLVKKGSKKKKKKSKNQEKESKKKNRQHKTVSKIESFMPQNAQYLIDTGVSRGGSSSQLATGGANQPVQGNAESIPSNDSRVLYYPDHSDYIGSFQLANNQVTVVSNKEELITISSNQEASKPKKQPAGIVRPTTSNRATKNTKTSTPKAPTKRPGSKPRRVPKSKEDLTIASMMGRVKQQVGDIDKIRTSQMFASSSQMPPKQTSKASTLLETIKINSTEHNDINTTTIPEKTVSTSSAVLNLIRTKAPPNITLPASHSSILPQALTESIKVTSSSIEQIKAQQEAIARSAQTSSIDSQQLNWIQDPRLFYGKATTNVYWGLKEHSLLTDVPQTVVEGVNPLPLVSQGNELELKTQPANVRIPANNDTKDLLHRATKMTNDIVDDGTTINLIKSVTDGSTGKNAYQAKVLGVSSESTVKYSLQQNLKNDTLSKMAAPATASSIAKESIPLGSLKENFTTHGNQAISNSPRSSSSVNEGKSTNSAVTTSENPSKSSPMVVVQVVSQSSPSNSITSTSSSSISTATVSTNLNATIASVGYPSYYGISNTTSMLRAPSIPYPSSAAATNPAQFLIMGSQASQALQHLALQQNNALQVSLQRGETPHPMYLQTISNYAPNALKTSHPNIGFAYPIQFMAIGGAQVVGKQPQIPTANIERYQNLYQYYQGVRPAEPTKTDTSKQVTSQATTLMYPGVSPVGQTPNNYVRIAPASVANRAALPPQLPTALPPQLSARFAVASEVNKADRQHHDATANTTFQHPVSKQNNYTNTVPVSSVPLKLEKTQKLPILPEKAKVDGNAKLKANEKHEPPTPESGPTNVKENLKSSPLQAHDKTEKTDSGPAVAEPEKGSTVQNSLPLSSNESISQSTVFNNMLLTHTNSLNVVGNPTSVATNVPPLAVSMIENAKRALAEPTTSLKLPTSDITHLHETLVSKDGKTKELQTKNPDDQDELNLQCNEQCNTASEESRTPTPDMNHKTDARNATILPNENLYASPSVRYSLKVGDLIWGHQKGYSAWPGKIVNESEVKEQCAEAGKVWVMWFGEHTHSQMELTSLKSLQEGLNEYRNSSRRRKNRSAKKTAESLEIAITEALREANTTTMTIQALQSNSEDADSEAKKPKR